MSIQKVRMFGKYLKPYRFYCILGPLAKLAEAVLELYLPFLMAKVIDKGISTGNTQYIFTMGGVMLGIVTVGLLCALYCQYVASITSQGFGTRLRNGVFSHITCLSHAQLDAFGTSSLINRVTGDINQLQLAVAMLIRLVIRAPFLCIGGIVMAVLIDWRLSLVIMVAVPLFLGVITLVMRKTIPLYRAVQGRLDGLTRVLRENLSGVRVIRAFARTREEQNRFDSATDEHVKAAVRVGTLSAVLSPATLLIMNMAILAIVWFGGGRVETGGMTTGEIIAFISYVNQILLALMVVANMVVLYTKAYASAGRVIEVLDTKPDLISVEKSLADTSCDVPAVEFQHVDFSYGKGDHALTDISFCVEKGEMVGVIGGTGSGKSTMLQLMMRFYETSGGKVKIDGVDVRDYALPDLRNKIGLVSQQVELFSGTISEAIRFGKEEATIEEVMAAARMAQAHEFIENLPQGYQSIVQRGGKNLSGGQRQRLTIARALVRKPAVLLLDDSASALDYATEAALRRDIRTGCAGMTIFMISQRVSTVQQCDRILVLDDGCLAGAGTHEILLSTCPVYREIYQSQERGNEVGA